MPVRALITAAVMFVCSGAGAEPWRAEVVPPRAGLPAVAVELGYPGRYVPTRNFPVVLRATAGEVPFDGYIGFHFRVGRNRTADIPVIARAVVRPYETWTFSTFASVRTRSGPLVPRQIAMEWRDASMNVTAVATAGGMTWTAPRDLQPLRIAADGSPASALGRTAWPAPPEALSDRAQWYDGFSDVVAPLGTWIDLPRDVREAIAGSGVPIVLFGLPRSDQQLDDLDRALLPVTFASSPGSYAAPWPYGNSTAIATPFSWTPKKNADAVGGGSLPYLARSSVGAWAADENGVSRPLPAAMVIPMSLQLARTRSGEFHPKEEISRAWPRPAQLLRANPAMLITVTAALLAMAGWLLLRKRPRAAMPLVLLIGAVVILAARDRIRPQAGVYRVEIEMPRSPGIVDVVQITRSWGPSPIPAEAADPETIRTSVTGAAGDVEDAEIRTSSTPMGLGVMRRKDDWHAVTRWSRRRTLGDAPSIRIASAEGKVLVVDYESSFPISSIDAVWLCGAELCRGDTAVPWGTSGRATIRDGRTTWSLSESWPIREVTMPHPMDTRPNSTHITLVQKTRWSTRMVVWRERAEQRPTGSFLIPGRAAFALPPEISPDASATVFITRRTASPELRLIWATGSTMLGPTSREEGPFGRRSYRVPPDVLRQIVAGGGIVHVDVPSGEPVLTTIEIWEKTS
ncbi:MAG TPA: hypothetical protein VNA04_13460 [Thermoanaerobaculia bacterium]|nr:hypothetical protein [Thermoanaerobaculia bacterium]